MLRTAGLCTTGKLRYPKRERYAKIQISLKVCDSAGDSGSRVAPLRASFPHLKGFSWVLVSSGRLNHSLPTTPGWTGLLCVA